LFKECSFERIVNPIPFISSGRRSCAGLLDVLSARAGNNSMRLEKIAQVTSHEDRSIRLALTPSETA
jgi:hypothetical protein